MVSVKNISVLLLVLLVNTIAFSQDSQGSDNILTIKKAGLKLEVTMDDVPQNHAVWLNFSITNSTDAPITFPFKYYWDFPMGMSAAINKKSGKSIIRFGSRHILASELLSPDSLRSDIVELQPGKSLTGTVNILDMVIMNDNYGDVILDPGKYIVSLTFLGNKSNSIPIQIERR